MTSQQNSTKISIMHKSLFLKVLIIYSIHKLTFITLTLTITYKYNFSIIFSYSFLYLKTTVRKLKGGLYPPAKW